jgi:hypothetical protein
MSITTVTINFHGIPLTVSGRYYEQEPETNSPAMFEIASIKVGITLAGNYRLEELHERSTDASALDYIEAEALALVESGFEAAACGGQTGQRYFPRF